MTVVVNHGAGRDLPAVVRGAHLVRRDWECLDYRDWLRWPNGFCCLHCRGAVAWRIADSRWRCSGCDREGVGEGGHYLR
ncbi:MAG: hypothetical protein GEU96_00180 [Propionibacteriales bacterium]|nr:hypothetical protein [Propionibacteriales bacterium]